MGSATIRRFALVAAMVLLAPVWSQTSLVARAARTPEAVFAAIAPVGTTPGPAIRRHSASGWWVYGSRPDFGRGLVAVAVVVLLSLLRLVPWGGLRALRSAPSPLFRRRHAIALRAPPLPCCA